MEASVIRELTGGSRLSLVPTEFHKWPLGAWDIGEQEAALTDLVKAITDSDTVPTPRRKAERPVRSGERAGR
jgi:hypothetical protein